MNTNAGPDEYWQVTLDDVYIIDHIKLWNRMDCCSHRLSLTDIQVIHNGQTELCVNTGDMEGIETKTFKCTETRMGNIVRISRTTDDALHLCEVEVYGRRP